MIYIIKQEGLYQSKVNSSLISVCNYQYMYSCTLYKMDYWWKRGAYLSTCLYKLHVVHLFEGGSYRPVVPTIPLASRVSWFFQGSQSLGELWTDIDLDLSLFSTCTVYVCYWLLTFRHCYYCIVEKQTICAKSKKNMINMYHFIAMF